MEVDIGKGLKVNVPDVNSFPYGEPNMAAVADYVWRMGWHNVLMDSHASVTRTSVADGKEMTEEEITAAVREQSFAKATEKLNAMLRGELRISGTRESKRDPVEAEAESIALGKIKDALKAMNQKFSSVDKEKVKAAVKQLAATEEVLKDARRIVAMRAKGRETLDLSQLGL